MRILICDDNEKEVAKLKENLLSFKCDEELLFESYADYESAQYRLRYTEFDMAFINVLIKRENGIELGRKVKEMFPECFLFFQNQDYDLMNEVFEVCAFQYLIKGDIDLLERNFERAMDVHHQRNLQMLFLTTNLEQHHFIPSEVLYVETGKAPSRLVTEQAIYYGEFDQINSLKKKLVDYHFFQVHQNFFVNLEHVFAVHRGEMIMDNGDVVPTSIYNKVFVDEALNRYINS